MRLPSGLQAGHIRESLGHESIFNLLHQESVIKVDCIIRKKTEYRRVEFERREKISILDFTTFIVSKEDLIISKLFLAKDSPFRTSAGRCAKSARDRIRRRVFAALDARTETGYVAQGRLE